MKGGTLWTKFASLPGPDLALGGFRNVPKKWTDQCEVCGLNKKKVFAIVGYFSLKGKRADYQQSYNSTSQENWQQSTQSVRCRGH